MNSKWQINRVGLLDFWYYDEEEFDFLDGRMLLRGANGSGKSVTMQSFIPLLLDGNMRPERLDPFGSRARKMENYLLEEGDEREERTGYLYMELKRLESEEYLTLGIGLRARKNKKLESWYFCVTDGRRVGKDLFLYKDVENKITCSKGELKYRIGEGGKVMETQGEYAQCVNRLLFGFETQEEYKELLELLIQLRTPKLSKDFKPTVINEILSSSLQTLSEDDLRPMSEAIENMDNLKTNLDTLSESIHAARQIEKVYDQYNQIVLYDKALLFSDAGKAYENCMKNGKQITEDLAIHMEELRKEEQHYEALKQEEEILKEEKTSLDKSDAAQLKEQESKLKAELLERVKEQQTKEKQEQEKKEMELLAKHKVNFIVLARYMQVISEKMINAYPNRIINIHHSFLPAFVGAKPYHAAFERGVKIIGATSHYVTTELDAGPIIEQDVVRITHKDTVQDLVNKGKDLEKIVLSRAVQKHIERKVLAYKNKTVIFN